MYSLVSNKRIDYISNLTNGVCGSSVNEVRKKPETKKKRDGFLSLLWKIFSFKSSFKNCHSFFKCKVKHTLRGCLHEIWSWDKWNIFKSVSAQSPITVYMKYSEMNLIGVISLRSFWQKWNFILGHKCYINTTLKWNHPKEIVCACECFISFRPQWKLV